MTSTVPTSLPCPLFQMAPSCKHQVELYFTCQERAILGSLCSQFPIIKHGPHSYFDVFLVGGFNSSENYESQFGWLFLAYGKKQIHVPVTTNQILYNSHIRTSPLCRHDLDKQSFNWWVKGTNYIQEHPIFHEKNMVTCIWSLNSTHWTIY